MIAVPEIYLVAIITSTITIAKTQIHTGGNHVIWVELAIPSP